MDSVEDVVHEGSIENAAELAPYQDIVIDHHHTSLHAMLVDDSRRHVDMSNLPKVALNFSVGGIVDVAPRMGPNQNLARNREPTASDRTPGPLKCCHWEVVGSF